MLTLKDLPEDFNVQNIRIKIPSNNFAYKLKKNERAYIAGGAFGTMCLSKKHPHLKEKKELFPLLTDYPNWDNIEITFIPIKLRENIFKKGDKVILNNKAYIYEYINKNGLAVIRPFKKYNAQNYITVNFYKLSKG